MTAVFLRVYRTGEWFVWPVNDYQRRFMHYALGSRWA